jgi:two-component system chemotaxis response regulator CheY
LGEEAVKILVVDDSKAMRLIVRRTLRQAGFENCEVAEAADGKLALDAIRAAPPDLVLSDWNMPEMTGIELLEELRREGMNVRFGFVTTEGTPDMRTRALEAGASFLLAKPFTPEQLRETLQKVGS